MAFLRLEHFARLGQRRILSRRSICLAALCLAAGNQTASFAVSEFPIAPSPSADKSGADAISTVKNPAEAESAEDVLILKNLDVMPGKLLSASSGGPVRWKPASGKETDIQANRIAGIRLATGTNNEALRNNADAASIQLRNGDRLFGEIITLDEKQIVFKYPQLGLITVERNRILSICPNRQADVVEGGSAAASPPRSEIEIPKSFRLAKASGIAITWLYLDGTYSQKISTKQKTHYNGALHWEVPAGLDRFEVRFEAAINGNGQPAFILTLNGEPGSGALQMALTYPSVQFTQPSVPGIARRPFWKAVSFQNKVPIVPSRMSVRALIDSKVGVINLFINGVSAAKIGQQASERVRGLNKTIFLAGYSNSISPIAISNVWIGPWNGETPRTENIPATILSNGDASIGAVSGFHDGIFVIDSELGVLQVQREKVRIIEFGGAMIPGEAKGKIRLTDASIINVESFQWTGSELTARSALLGDLRFPADAVAELIFNPPAVSAK